MSRRKAFGGFGGPGQQGPDPHDVARIGTHLALATGLRSGLEQKAHQAILQGLAGPAAIADSVSEVIGNAVEDGVGDAQLLAKGIVDKAQGRFMREIITPTESAIRLGWVPAGAPGSGAGGKSRRPRGASPGTGQPAGRAGPPLSQPAGSESEAPGVVPGASAANMAPAFPAPGGPPGLPAAPGGPSASYLPPGPSAGQPGASAGQQMFGGPPLSGGQVSSGALAQPPNWMVLADCSVGNWTILDQSDPAFPLAIQGGQYVPLRVGFGPDFEAALEWARACHGVASYQAGALPYPSPTQIACVAFTHGGQGWPAGGEFGCTGAPLSNIGRPPGDWPFNPDGSDKGS